MLYTNPEFHSSHTILFTIVSSPIFFFFSSFKVNCKQPPHADHYLHTKDRKNKTYVFSGMRFSRSPKENQYLPQYTLQ